MKNALAIIMVMVILLLAVNSRLVEIEEKKYRNRIQLSMDSLYTIIKEYDELRGIKYFDKVYIYQVNRPFQSNQYAANLIDSLIGRKVKYEHLVRPISAEDMLRVLHSINGTHTSIETIKP